MYAKVKESTKLSSLTCMGNKHYPLHIKIFLPKPVNKNLNLPEHLETPMRVCPNPYTQLSFETFSSLTHYYTTYAPFFA